MENTENNQKMQQEQNAEKEKKKKKKMLLVIILLLLLTVTLSGGIVWYLFIRDVSLVPDYAPQEEDPTATVMDDDGERLDAPEGGGAVGITYTPDVTIDLSEERATFIFQNPSRSKDSVIVQIVIQDEVVAQSGKLVPGRQLDGLDLLNGAAKKLSPGGYEGKLVISLYNPDTAEKSMINSEGMIDITVVE